ncbi:MAG: hypothetical protein ACI9WL_001337, partial [Rubritalea sp.]
MVIYNHKDKQKYAILDIHRLQTVGLPLDFRKKTINPDFLSSISSSNAQKFHPKTRQL